MAIRCYRYGHRYAMVVHRLSDGTAKAGYVPNHDTLTALPNRWAFEQEIGYLKGYKQPFILATVDIIHFRSLNESLGTAAGDRCLMEVGARIKGAVDESDRVYRMGDDQFVVVSTRGKAETLGAIGRIKANLAQPLLLNGHECVIQVNIGLCTPVLSDTGAEALSKAQLALAYAKTHKVPYAEYSPDMKAPLGNPMLTKEIQDALLRKEFELHLQPQIDLIDGKVCGCEALLRWNHPTKGLVTPDAFLPFAEEAGLIQSIDAAVVDMAFKELEAIAHDGLPVHISFNLSAQTICDPATVDLIRKHLHASEVNPERVCIEITETSLMRDIASSQMVIEDLKSMGIQIAIDDFGSGYSSMAYLVRYPPQFLKIDRMFVCDLTHSESHRVMVRNMIGLAHGLGVCVVAEGIESKEERDLLSEFGCDVGQGYLFSPPLRAADFRDWTAEHGTTSLSSDIR